MKYYVTVEGREHVIDVLPDRVLVDGVRVDVELASTDGSGQFSALVDGRSLSGIARRRRRGDWQLLLDGDTIAVEAIDERARHIREISATSGGRRGPRPVRAPMPGMVVQVEVEVGDQVSAGTGLVVVEAMKMENELKAERDATVASVLVQAGQAVEKDQILLEFEQPDQFGPPDTTDDEDV